jgi:hypothetical protein
MQTHYPLYERHANNKINYEEGDDSQFVDKKGEFVVETEEGFLEEYAR